MIRFSRLSLLYVYILAALMFAAVSNAKPTKKDAEFDYIFDLSPIRKAAETVDCKIHFTAETLKGDTFKKAITINGSVTDATAENVLFGLKTLLEADRWEVKELTKTQLLVVGKQKSPTVKIAVEAQDLARLFHPLAKKLEKKDAEKK